MNLHRGLVAQRIERLRPKEGVGGSSPSEAANFRSKIDNCPYQSDFHVFLTSNKTFNLITLHLQ